MAVLRWLAQAIIATLMVVAIGVLATDMLAPSTTPSDRTSDRTVTIEHPVIVSPMVPVPAPVNGLTADTGYDTQPYHDFAVYGTDLGIPFALSEGEVGHLFGDTLAVAGPFLDLPPGIDHYRPQVMLRSRMMPAPGQPIIFDSAAGISGKGMAPELLNGGHLLPNDGVTLPDGRVVLSYQRIAEGENTLGIWHTDQAGLAVSLDGGDHFELTGPVWENDASNTDPFQMWSMQLDGEFVYIVSVRAGRQPGPMMLFRVHWDQILDQGAYEYWNGSGWGAKEQAAPILNGHFGEPSLRKLSDGTWAMAYADYFGGSKIVTRVMTDPSRGPEGPWSTPKVQLSWRQLPALYGGFIHPWSTKENLVLIVSSWQREDDGTEHGKLIFYGVYHFNGTL